MSKEKLPDRTTHAPFHYLTLQGNGIYAFCSIGALKEMDDRKLLEGIKEVAGASLSGLVALLIALGYTPDEVAKELALFHYSIPHEPEKGGWIDPSQGNAVAKSLEKEYLEITDRAQLLKLLPWIKKLRSLPILAQQITVNQGLAIEKMEDLVGLSLGFNFGLWKPESFFHRIGNLIAQKVENKNITFLELQTLSQKKDSRLKALHLSATNLSDETFKRFNVHQTPNLPIIEALLVCCSFPGGYKPLLVDDRIWVDGGLNESLPSVFNQEPYHRPKATEIGNPSTLAIVASGDPTSDPIKNGVDLASELYKRGLSSEAQTQFYGPRLIVCKPSGIPALEMRISRFKINLLIEEGRRAAEKTFQKLFKSKKANKANKAITEVPHEQLIRKPKLTKEKARHLALDLKKEFDFLWDQILSQMKQLEIVRQALFFRRHHLNALLQDTDFKNEFYNNLHILSEHQEKIRKTHKKLVDLENAYRTHAMIQETEYRTKRSRLMQDWRGLKQARDLFLEGLLKKYQNQGNNPVSDLCIGFYEDLQEQVRSTPFVVPTTPEGIKKHLSKDLLKIKELIATIRSKMKNVKDLQKRLKMQEKVDPLDYYRTLQRAISLQTDLLSKINAYLLQKSPVFQFVVSPYLKFVAFSAFSYYGSTELPDANIAKAIQFYGKSAEEQTSAMAFMDFLSVSEINFDHKMKGFQALITQFLQKLDKDYLEKEVLDETILFKLFDFCLGQSDLKLEIIFSQKPAETNETYQKRVEWVQKKLKVTESYSTQMKEKEQVALTRLSTLFRNVRAKLGELTHPVGKSKIR